MPRKGFRPGKHPEEISKKEMEKKKKDFEERVEKMKPELIAICKKYRIDVVGSLEYRPNGVFPSIAYLDSKEKYESMEKQEEEEKLPSGLIT